jgi:glycosyltransferase involved in cell wall biosynthesis
MADETISGPATIKILHFSSHDEDCGVGKYQENYLVGMNNAAGIENKFFDVSPYQTRVMGPEGVDKVMAQLAKELQDYDILHIQHEFGLYWFDQFKKIVDTAKNAGKKVVVTVHLSPGFAIKRPVRKGLGPRSILKLLLDKRNYARMIEWHMMPMQRADLVIAHNEPTIQSLKYFGIDPAKIKKMTHPVYSVPTPPESHEIREALHKQDGDIIFCSTGFLHKYKGTIAAVRALTYLPDNYKLALIGGVKADSDEVVFQDKITNLAHRLGVQDRLYVTGFIQDDDRMNALIRECDVCVYPYDRVYYASASSGSLNLAFANDKPVISYPTGSFKEVAELSDGAVVLTSTFAYYELARELKRIDLGKQAQLSSAYAEKMAWPKMSAELIKLYQGLVGLGR